MFELLVIDLKAQCERIIKEMLKIKITHFFKIGSLRTIRGIGEAEKLSEWELVSGV